LATAHRKNTSSTPSVLFVLSRPICCLLPPKLDMAFGADPTDLWNQILRAKGWKYRLIASAPEDLSLN